MKPAAPEPSRCTCIAPAPGDGPSAAAAAAGVAFPHFRSTFRIPGMDCPAEEQLIRLRLAELPPAAFRFDLAARTLAIDHAGPAADLLRRLEPLGFGATLESTAPLEGSAEARRPSDGAADRAEARVLATLLAINAAMFAIEMLAGWWAGSAGLIADAADMFADAAVYGVALYAVGRAASRKLLAARLAGVLQLALALGSLAETARRAFVGGVPEEAAMIGVAVLALAANATCLALIWRHRGGGVHMRASAIFSAGDVLANLGVIVAGVLVAWTGRAWPDWAVGAAIGALVLAGALRILRLR